MSRFFVFLFASLIILLLYCIAIYVYTWIAKRKISQTMEKASIIRRTANLNKEIKEQASLIHKHKAIQKYLGGIDTLLEVFLENENSIRIVSLKTFDPTRLALLREYRRATKHVQHFVIDYSELLRDIYKRKHPIKYTIDLAIKNLLWKVTFVYVFFLIMYKRITGTLPDIGKNEKRLDLKADKKDYDRLKDAEPGLCSATI